MKIFKNFLKEKMELAVGAGVMASLLILGCMKMRHSSDNSETVVIIINN